MRILYSSLFYLILPLVLLRLYIRGNNAPLYRKRWLERLAIYRHKPPVGEVIWFHAVSVGEAEALFPLLRLFKQRCPSKTLLVTTTTPTGSERVKSVLKDTVHHVYLPYDMPDCVNRFMGYFKPEMAVIMETEIWPNLFTACSDRSIPLFLVNARLSEKSAQGYKQLAGLARKALLCCTAIAAQSREDAERYIALGANSETVYRMGNIKFDLAIDSTTLQTGIKLKQNQFKGRQVWIAASTHKGEDELLLEVYRAVKNEFPGLLLVLVPRHPERFQEVRKKSESLGFSVVMRSQQTPCGTETDIYIGDTMGELKMLYAASDLAFVAGSLLPIGGHNVLEAAVLGVPVIFGAHMFNFKEIATGLLAVDAAIQCQDTVELENILLRMLRDPESARALGQRGKQFVEQNKGALETTYQLLQSHINENQA